jgi:hypothetical protein
MRTFVHSPATMDWTLTSNRLQQLNLILGFKNKKKSRMTKNVFEKRLIAWDYSMNNIHVEFREEGWI